MIDKAALDVRGARAIFVKLWVEGDCDLKKAWSPIGGGERLFSWEGTAIKKSFKKKLKKKKIRNIP